MKEDVAEQRRNYTPLRGPSLIVLQLAFLHHPGVEPFANQTDNAAVVDPLADKSPQVAMVQIVEQPSNICVDDPADIQLPQLPVKLVHSPVLAAALAETVGKVIEHLFIDRAQKHLYRPLDYLVLKGRLADWAPLPVFLLQPHPHHRRGLIKAAAHSLAKIHQVLFKVLTVLPGRHLV